MYEYYLNESIVEADEYPDPGDVGRVDGIVEQSRGPGRPRKPALNQTREEAVLGGRRRLESYKQAAIDLVRESGYRLTRKEICDRLQLRPGDAHRIFKDARFVLNGRGQAVGLNDAAIEVAAKSLCNMKESAIKNARELVYAELAQFGAKSLDALVAILKFDRRLIAKALEDRERFYEAGGLWRRRRRKAMA